MSESNYGSSPELVATELRRVREAAGLSQEQMAAKLGMNYAPGGRKVSTGRAAVSAWERGRRVPPRELLQAYIDLGGNAAILAPPANEQAISTQLEAELCSKIERYQGDDREPEQAIEHRRAWYRHRGRQVAVAVLVVVLGTGIGILESGRHPHQSSASTWTETTGTPAHTWANPTQLTGAGTPLGPRQSVQVSCRMRGYVVQDGDPWWYRLESAPWNGHYYATSDAFYNNGDTSGSVINGIIVDEQVPLCPGSKP